MTEQVYNFDILFMQEEKGKHLLLHIHDFWAVVFDILADLCFYTMHTNILQILPFKLS